VNLQAVLARSLAPIEQRYGWRDAALYALSLGMGSDPLDADELPYVYEGFEPGRWGDAAGLGRLRAVPSMCVTLGWLPFWQDDAALGIAWQRIVHGEMSFELHRPLGIEGHVRCTHRIVAIDDKGAERGAVMHVDKELVDAAGGAPIASLRSVEFLRGDGGCGSFASPTVQGEPRTALPALPAAFSADSVQEYATARQAALLYRLASGDLMPIHADPATAAAAGFERPISHGLNNLGIACRAVLKSYLPGQPQRIKGMAVRFAAPGLPGDTVRIEMMRRGSQVVFRAWAVERSVLLLDRGAVTLG
jgi:acyl dehydratase